MPQEANRDPCLEPRHLVATEADGIVFAQGNSRSSYGSRALPQRLNTQGKLQVF